MRMMMQSAAGQPRETSCCGMEGEMVLEDGLVDVHPC